MDIPTARKTLNRELEELRWRRSRLQRDLDDTGIDIGARAAALHELGQPKARSAEMAGVSASHLTELVAKAREAGKTINDPLDRLPVLKGAELQEFVAHHGGPARIIASFHGADVMHMSKLEPTAFLEGNRLISRHMMIQCADDDWTIVENVQVGYGGTGPGNARQELTGIGLDPDTAERIAHTRVSDVQLDHTLKMTADSLFTNDWPRYELGGLTLVADRFVVTMTLDGFGQIPASEYAAARAAADTHNGFEPIPPAMPPLQAWLERFDDETIPWLQGTRRARVYLDRNAAERDGYTMQEVYGYGRGPVYTVIIEQGPVQLWLNAPRSNDPTQRYAPEVHAALGAAGFYSEPLDPTAGRGTFVRWLADLGRTPPPYVDLNGWPLRHPDPAATHSR